MAWPLFVLVGPWETSKNRIKIVSVFWERAWLREANCAIFDIASSREWLRLSPAGSFTLKRKKAKAVLVLKEGGGMVEEGGGPDHSKTASDGPVHVLYLLKLHASYFFQDGHWIVQAYSYCNYYVTTKNSRDCTTPVHKTINIIIHV